MVAFSLMFHTSASWNLKKKIPIFAHGTKLKYKNCAVKLFLTEEMFIRLG